MNIPRSIGTYYSLFQKRLKRAKQKKIECPRHSLENQKLISGNELPSLLFIVVILSFIIPAYSIIFTVLEKISSSCYAKDILS